MDDEAESPGESPKVAAERSNDCTMCAAIWSKRTGDGDAAKVGAPDGVVEADR